MRAVALLLGAVMLVTGCSGSQQEAVPDPTPTPAEEPVTVVEPTVTAPDEVLTRTVRVQPERSPIDVGSIVVPSPACPNGATEDHLDPKLPLRPDDISADDLAVLQVLQADLGRAADLAVEAGVSGEVELTIWYADRPLLVAAVTGRGLDRLCVPLRDGLRRPQDLLVLCCNPDLVGESIVEVLVADALLGETDEAAVVSAQLARNGRYRVVLSASAEEAAAELQARFGTLVDMTVGQQGYPPDPEAEPNTSVCGVLGTGDPVEDLGIEIVEGEVVTPVALGDDGFLVVTLRNSSDDRFVFSNPRVAATTGSGRTAQLAAPNPKTTELPPLRETLRPGADQTITATVGTASCVPSLGYQLPPGRYDAVLLLQLDQGAAEIRVPFVLEES